MAEIVFEKLVQTLAAGQMITVTMAGDFFRLAGAAFPVTVALLKNSRIVGHMDGMLAGDYVKDMPFDGVVITNGATAQAVTFQIAGGGAGSDRVLGEVSVINGELQRVKADMAFIGRSSVVPAAGQFAHCQLWNPVASGKNVVLGKMTIASMAAGHFIVNVNNAPLATLYTAGASKRLGGPASAAECRAEASVSQIGATTIFNYDVQVVSESREYPFSEPLIIPPGFGLVVMCQVAAAQTFIGFQWLEEAV